MPSATADVKHSEHTSKSRRRPARKINEQKVKELHAKGLNTSEIARHQGVNQSTVWRFLDRTEPDRQALERFKAGRADAFADLQAKAISVQHKIIESIQRDVDNGVSEAWTANEKGRLLDALNTVQGTIFDKERLERGESTANVSTVSRMVDASVSSLHKRNTLIDNDSAIDADSRT